MAAPTPSRRPVVEFDVNVPVEVALKFNTGKIISTRTGERVMFTTTKDEVFFMDLGPAQKINDLGVNVGESFSVCRRKKGSAPVEWDVWLSPETEKQRAAAEDRQRESETPSELERKLAQSIHLAKAGLLGVGERKDGTFAIPAPPAPAPPSAPVVAEDPLVTQANVLIDAFAVVLERALTMYGGKVKPDEVRAIFLTAAINCAKAGR